VLNLGSMPLSTELTNGPKTCYDYVEFTLDINDPALCMASYSERFSSAFISVMTMTLIKIDF